VPPLVKYEDLAEYLDRNIDADEGKRFEKVKVEFAATVCPMLSREGPRSTLDLPARLTRFAIRLEVGTRLETI
jgi:hypothetical protein